MQQAGKSTACAVEGFHKSPIHSMARLLKALIIEEAQHALQFLREVLLLRVRKDGPRQGLNMKEIHNLLARQPGFPRGAETKWPCVAPGGRRRDRVGGCENASLTNVEAERGQQPAQDGELRKVIVRDNDEIKRSVGAAGTCRF